MAMEYKLSYTASEIDDKLGKIDTLVATVNGVAPDENGNVEIAISSEPGNTDIGSYAFYNCYSLASITIPEGVTSIDRSAFQNCHGIRYYDFTASASVPALSSANAFSDIQSDCQMLIPAALYDEWSAATNWATYASYMVAV